MKKILLLFFSFLFHFSFAQSEKVKEYKWQITILTGSIEPMPNEGFVDPNLNIAGASGSHRKDKSYNVGLNLSYTIKESLAARLSFKMTKYNITSEVDSREVTPFSASEYYIASYNSRSSSVNICPGILWKFPYEIITPYAGFEINYKKYDNANINALSTSYDTLNNFLHSQSTEYKQGGGYSIGVGPFVGFSLKTFRRIAIGTELSFAMSYYEFGGRAQAISTYVTPTSTISNASTPQTINSTSEGFGLLNIYVSIHIAISI